MEQNKITSLTSQELYMKLALDKAWQFQLLTYPNPAVGALIVYNNEIVALEAHQKAGTSHAEILALLKAYEIISGKKITFDRFNAKKSHDFLYALPPFFFSECIVYVTLEPCSHEGRTPSCATLLSYLRPKKVVVAVLDTIIGHDGGVLRLRDHGIEVDVGICKNEALVLLEPFFIWQKRAFVLFKIAQTANGKIGGGYLTSKESLTHVHKLRAVCTEMFIGGNTVRLDRPTLDCRFTKAKAPDIKIYSQKNNFDKNIPLFSVPGRDVFVTDKIENLDRPSFILVEGGEGMLNAFSSHIDFILQYEAPFYSINDTMYSISIDLQYLYSMMIGVDTVKWIKNTKYKIK